MDALTRRGSLEMTAAMLISGTIGWFVLVSGQPVLDVVFWRCLFGAGALLLICGAFGFLRRNILTRRSLFLAVLSGVAIVGNWVLLFGSYSRASIAIGTAVYNVQPFILVALGALFLGEKITPQKLFWLCLSFAGMLAIVSAHGGEGETGNDYLLGIALALGAALLYAFAALLIKRLSGTPPHLIALIQVCTGCCCWRPGQPRRTTPAGHGLGQPADPGHRAYRGDVCAVVRGDPEAADGADRGLVLHLSDRGDLRRLAGLRASPGTAAVAGRRRDPAGRRRHAAGLDPQAPAQRFAVTAAGSRATKRSVSRLTPGYRSVARCGAARGSGSGGACWPIARSVRWVPRG